MSNEDRPIAGFALLRTPSAPPSFWTDLHDQLVHVVDKSGAAPVAAARRQRSPWRRVAGVAAASVVAAGGVVLWRSGDDQTAAAAVLSAAEAMGDVTSYEGQRTHVEPDGTVETMTLRVNGEDLEFVSETRFADGRVEHFAVTVVDQVGYVTEDGRTTVSTLRPGEGLNADYGEASAALVTAALDGADVTESGRETVDGVLATRYDVALADRSIAALSALPEEHRGMFDLEDPENVDELTVWVADDHIRQIEIAHSDGATTRTTFSNLNGDVTITPPPGPYADEPGDRG